MIRRYALAAVLLTAALVLAGCGPQSVSFSSSMTEFEFDPPRWQAPAGAEVTLTLTNDGSVVHDWVLMPRGYQVEPPAGEETLQQALVEFSVEAGETETFTFTAPGEAGEYAVICTEPGHLEAGMSGTLVVE